MMITSRFILIAILFMSGMVFAKDYEYSRTFDTHNTFEENFNTINSEKLSELNNRLKKSLNINFNPDVEMKMVARPTQKYCKFELETKQTLGQIKSAYHYIEIKENKITTYIKFDINIPHFGFTLMQRSVERLAEKKASSTANEVFDYEQRLLEGCPLGVEYE